MTGEVYDEHAKPPNFHDDRADAIPEGGNVCVLDLPIGDLIFARFGWDTTGDPRYSEPIERLRTFLSEKDAKQVSNLKPKK